MNLQATGELINKDTIATIAAIFGILTSALTILKWLTGTLKKPIKEHNEIYKKANISLWVVRCFCVGISLKKIPKLTRFELFFFTFLMILCITLGMMSSYIFIKIVEVPDGWTALTLKDTGENFLITKNKASEHALKPSWYVDDTSCKSGQGNSLVDKGKISKKLSIFLCNIIEGANHDQELSKSIADFKKKKGLISFAMLSLGASALWFFISVFLNMYFVKKLRFSILEDQKKAENYLT